MKYIGQELTKEESTKKHSEHINKNEIVFATSDGNAFVGDRAKSFAHSNAASYRPALLVFDLKEENAESGVQTPEERFKELNKLTAPLLKELATELNVEFESDANKATVANAIIAHEANAAE